VTDYRNWLNQAKGDKCIENLRKHDFDALFCQTSSEAEQLIVQMTQDYTTIGFGGSDTTRSLGLPRKLAAKGKIILNHNDESLSPEDSLRTRKEQSMTDCFICSANAVAITGEIINIDGVGNRTNALTFGPQKVIMIAGVNKLVPDVQSGIQRIKAIAAPMRAKSLNMNTPCTKTGICSDCNSPMRICRITSILNRKPFMTDITIIIVNEELGY
jgi:hypothetical protein